MNFHTFTGPVVAAGLLLASTACSSEPKPPTIAEMTPQQRYEQLLAIRGEDKVCHGDTDDCNRWTELMLGCETEQTRTCMDAEQLRERITGVQLSSAPGAYNF